MARRAAGPSFRAAVARVRCADDATFERRLRAAVSRSRRDGRNAALLVLRPGSGGGGPRGAAYDETFVHTVGDALAGFIRHDHVVGRLGARSIGWFIPDIDEAAVAALAAHVRRATGSGPEGAERGGRAGLGVATLDRSASGLTGELLDDAVAAVDGPRVAAAGAGTDGRPARVPRGAGPHGPRSGPGALTRALAARDLPTMSHSDRVGDLARLLATRMGWPEEAAQALREAAALHDVGKLGVPDAVLLKPGPLTPGEFEIIAMHPELGAEIAASVLDAAQVEWVLHHHERWDGTGYPDGSSGREIPEGAAILGLADAWDAMTTSRPYRAAMPPADALDECVRLAGRQFAPDGVAALQALWRLDEPLLTAAAPATAFPVAG